MQDHGDQLGVDLNELYRTAHYLSAVHSDYEQAIHDVNSAQLPHDSSVWMMLAPSPWTPMAPAWDALREAIATLLAGNAETINDTSLALTAIAQRYAATDQAAAARLASLEQSDKNEQGW